MLGAPMRVAGSSARPPHFPDPNATAIGLLEQGIADRDAQIAEGWQELQATRRRLEQAIELLNKLTGAKHEHA